MATTRPHPSPVATATRHPTVGPRCEISRGPNWLIVRVEEPQLGDQSEADADRLAGDLWSICDCHFTYRLVIEVEEHSMVSLDMATALSALGERLAERGGSLRVCGLDERASRRLEAAHSPLQTFSNRRDAVLSSECHRPVQHAK